MDSPKTKKKSAAKTSRKLKKRSSICSRTDVSEHDPGHQGADRLGEAELSAIAAVPTRNANTDSRKNSSGRRSRKRSSGPASQREARPAVTNARAFATRTSVSETSAAGREPEHEGDDDVLENEDREDGPSRRRRGVGSR